MDPSLPEDSKSSSETVLEPSTAGHDESSSGHPSSSSNFDKLPTAAENELIDLDDIDFSDEDTWLYTPPRTLSSEEKGLSPYKWLRQDVENPNNRELQMAKSALVSKLHELDILKSVRKASPVEINPCFGNSPLKGKTGKKQIEEPVSNCDKCIDLFDKGEAEKTISTASETSSEVCLADKIEAKKSLNDVSDVFERARQQEESLKQSSSRFFSQSVRTLPRSKGSLPCPAIATPVRLSKPASVEALHMYGGRCGSAASSPSKLQPKTVIPSPSVSPYSSMVSLSYINGSHHGSLPNLNRGSNTPKQRISKRTSEPRVQCPLPAYPKPYLSSANRGSNEATQTLTPRSSARFGAQTLPSSFRNSKTRRSLNDATSYNSLARRDSDPQSQCQKNSLKTHVARRDSMPSNLIQAKYNLYPRKGQGQHYTSSPVKLNGSRTGSFNPLMPDLIKNNFAFKEFPPRCVSNSPAKRQPLTSVHNLSPDEEHGVSSNNSLQKPSLPSKIPSPTSRSVIPVSSEFRNRVSNSTADDIWSQDSF